ncbi:MAG: hypothetical protein IPG94_06340 [Kineosporiaceae bacterium]|nr:hypothetical protein [Kineosporiaceae bacterium]
MTHFSVTLPPSWFEFDGWRATHTGELARLVDRRLEEQPSLAPLRGRIVRSLRDVAVQADRAGVVFAAAMVEPLTDRNLLLASAFGAVQDVPEGVGDPDVETIAAQITSTAGRHVTMTEIPAGRCVRVTAVQPSDEADRSVTMQTLVPVPGEQRVLNFVMSSPHVELADALLDLFDAVSSTVQWSPSAVS